MKAEYTIIQDDREKKPLVFPARIPMLDDKSLPSMKVEKTVRIKVKKATLPTGDYVLEGYEDRVIVERKGHLGEISTNCLSVRDRDRFIRELDRLKVECDRAVVMLEGTPALFYQGWRGKHDPHLAVDALQRLLSAYGVELLLLPSSTRNHLTHMGDWVARLLINGALTNDINPRPCERSHPTADVPG